MIVVSETLTSQFDPELSKPKGLHIELAHFSGL